jgi:fatty-acyl-CoA synthase
VHESFATVWERNADALPDAPAVVQGAQRVTYAEVEDRAARLATALAARGVGPGTKVALFLHNCPEYMELLFALSKLRAVPANVNFRYLGAELAQLATNADAEVIVHHRSLRDRVETARAHTPLVRSAIEIDDHHGDSEYEGLLRTHEPAPRIKRSGDDIVLWYTGGTTGLPKGVVWQQGTLVHFGVNGVYALQGETPSTDEGPDALDRLADDVARWRAAGTAIVSLLTTPLVHATAVHQANSVFCAGGTVVLLERGQSSGDDICRTIERERPTVLEVVGDVLVRRIADALDTADARGEPYDLSSLRRVHNAGAMVSAPLKDALLSRGTMHVYDSLGSSEGTGFGVALTTEPARFRLGPNARLLVAADRDEDVVPGSGDVGVLAVHTSCGSAYYNDPERSATTFRVLDGRIHAIPGDHALLDADGTLVLLGRGSNCINTGGEKVWPEEVEEVLKEHPAVVDAVVLGVADDEWGQVVVAVVATGDGQSSGPAELDAWVGARLASYKRPRRFVFAGEIGRNTVGKLDYEWARRAVTD